MIKNIRLTAQQLVNPQFEDPKDLIKWMGAVQAQEYTMMKWAVGMRLKNGTLSSVQKAMDTGQIVRTHIMRPTWHLVAGEDIRWLLQLSGKRIRNAIESYAKKMVPLETYSKSNRLLEKILQGNRHLSRQEIEEEFKQAGFEMNPDSTPITLFLGIAEADGIVCSGKEKNKKPTYTLLEEWVPPVKEFSKEEALATLAKRYFQSHSPATLQDFIWWSGLTATECKQGIELIRPELDMEKLADHELFIHHGAFPVEDPGESFIFLPPYDEYLISYKSRHHCLATEHTAKAFNNYGIFYPVTVYNGQVCGNWKRASKKGCPLPEHSFFLKQKIKKSVLEKGWSRYKAFLEL